MNRILFSIIVLLFMFCGPVISFAQQDNQGMTLNKPFERKEKPETDFLEKLFVGGNVGLQIGTYTSIDVSPMVGYRLTDKLSAGVGGTYLFLKQRFPDNTSFSTNVYGGRVFGRYFILDNIFAHAEYEVLNLEGYDLFYKRKNVASILAGAGYSQQFSEHFYSNLTILWCFSESVYSPYYSPLIIRPGFIYMF